MMKKSILKFICQLMKNWKREKQCVENMKPSSKQRVQKEEYSQTEKHLQVEQRLQAKQNTASLTEQVNRFLQTPKCSRY